MTPASSAISILAALHEKSVPGPWVVGPEDPDCSHSAPATRAQALATYECIAATHAALPALLDVARAAQKVCEWELQRDQFPAAQFLRLQEALAALDAAVVGAKS